jgi:Holliday junction resolvase-like predicted endonuclease
LDFEKNFLVSVLKLTKDGQVPEEIIAKDARVGLGVASRILFHLEKDGIISLSSGVVELSDLGRLRLAVKAISLGVDSERISSFLSWQEFESVSGIALERNGYNVVKNLRFKGAGRRWEIDLVGFRKPLVLCIDCKHWRKSIVQSSLKKIVEEQTERTRAFCEVLPNILQQLECSRWDRAKFLPTIVTLLPGYLKFYEDVPIVSVLQVQDFLLQIPAFVGSVKCFAKNFSHLV